MAFRARSVREGGVGILKDSFLLLRTKEMVGEFSARREKATPPMKGGEKPPIRGRKRCLFPALGEKSANPEKRGAVRTPCAVKRTNGFRGGGGRTVLPDPRIGASHRDPKKSSDTTADFVHRKPTGHPHWGGEPEGSGSRERVRDSVLLRRPNPSHSKGKRGGGAAPAIGRRSLRTSFS